MSGERRRVRCPLCWRLVSVRNIKSHLAEHIGVANVQYYEGVLKVSGLGSIEDVLLRWRYGILNQETLERAFEELMKIIREITRFRKVYRTCASHHLKLWRDYGGYCVRESMWRRVPLSLYPCYLYVSPLPANVYDSLFEKVWFEYIPQSVEYLRDRFIVEFSAEELAESGVALYPALYLPSAKDFDLASKVLRVRYAHFERFGYLFECGVFTVCDLPLRYVRRVYTLSPGVEEFFSSVGVTVVRNLPSDLDVFTRFRTLLGIVVKAYNMRWRPEFSAVEDMIRKLCEEYDTCVVERCLELGAERCSTWEEAVAVPQYVTVREYLVREGVLPVGECH